MKIDPGHLCLRRSFHAAPGRLRRPAVAPFFSVRLRFSVSLCDLGISVISVLDVTISSTTVPVALLAGWCGRCWKPKAPG